MRRAVSQRQLSFLSLNSDIEISLKSSLALPTYSSAENSHAQLALQLCVRLSLTMLFEIPVTHPKSLPYLTLPYGEDVLPSSAEASNGPNAHP